MEIIYNLSWLEFEGDAKQTVDAAHTAKAKAWINLRGQSHTF